MEQKYQLRIAIVAALARYELPQNFETIILDDAILSVFGRRRCPKIRSTKSGRSGTRLRKTVILCRSPVTATTANSRRKCESSVKEATANPLLPERILPGDTFFWGIEAVK